jgi:nucleolar protein 12
MSLLQSIFGAGSNGKGEEGVAPGSPPSNDLFQTTVPVPEPDASSSKKKRKAATASSEAAGVVSPTGDAQNDEDSRPAVGDHNNSNNKSQKRQRRNNNNTAENEHDKEQRTIFVGNVSIATTRKQLTALFSTTGSKVESVRLRSVAVTGVQLPPSSAGNQNLVKKICTNTQQVDASVKNSLHAYVVFADVASVAAAIETFNNYSLDGHCLRVDTCKPTIDPQRSVFVGNLPYTSQEESLRQHFVTALSSITTTATPTKKGDTKNHPATASASTSSNNNHQDIVHGVRIVRDKETFQCRGFGYVLLADKSLVAAALQQVHGTTYLNKEIRVMVCGKRFKGKQGQYNAAEKQKIKKLPPRERVADTTGALKRMLTKQILEGGTTRSPRSKRLRGEKSYKAPGKIPNAAGKSKRQASVAKVDKREKKIQKRMVKGMGKSKKA